MYTGLLHTHSMFRWLMLAILVLVIILFFMGWQGKKKWSKSDSVLSLILMIIADLQLFTGFMLYFFASPITREALKDFGTAMKNSNLRFFAVEHLFMMVIAVILIHVGRTKAAKAVTDLRKYKVQAIFYTISLVLILAAIPWSRL